MRRALRLPFWLMVVTMLVPALAIAAKPYRIAGAQKGAEGWQPEEVLEQSRNGVAFQIRFLEPETRRQTMEKALGRDLDLLPGRLDERRPGYLVFALQIDNRSPEDVHFNPGQARLASDKGDLKFALDYTALFEVARRLPDPPELDQLGSILFDRPVTIRSGGSVRKLIAFDAPREDRYRTLDVLLVEINVGTTGVDVVFPFRKFFEKR